MTVRLALREYQTRAAVALTSNQVQAVRRLVPSLRIEPSREPPGGGEPLYDLTPGSDVGVVQLGDLVIEITPKIDVGNVLFIVSYCLNPDLWRPEDLGFVPSDSIVEAMLYSFVTQVERALRQGMLQGYREVEEASPVLRGRVRFGDQLRRWYGRAIPVEVRYDDFTVDTELNRLLKAALFCAGRLPLRSETLAQRIGRQEAALEQVSLVEYDARQLPTVSYNRLNERYRAAIALAQLILRQSSYDLRNGGVIASAFLVDMNKAFEDFVVVALREALRLSAAAFPQGCAGRRLTLDEGGRIKLEPDLSWWEGPRCVFAGDAKYKRSGDRGGANPDLYQLHAYLVAAGLTEGLLIYAAGEEEPCRHLVRMDRRILDVHAFDLAASPRQVLEQIATIAVRVREIRSAGTARGVIVASHD